MSTLPKIRVKARGNKFIIKSDTLPKSKKSAVLTLTRKQDVKPSPNIPKTPQKQANRNAVKNNNNTILKYSG